MGLLYIFLLTVEITVSQMRTQYRQTLELCEKPLKIVFFDLAGYPAAMQLRLST